MSANEDSWFGFATCQPGAETALKAELAAGPLQARPAFMRPGLITFKSEAEDRGPALSRGYCFAQVIGQSLGMVRGDEVRELASSVWATPAVQTWIQEANEPTIHCWRRAPRLTENLATLAPESSEFQLALQEAAPTCQWGPAEREHLVLDVIEVDPGVVCLGTHEVHNRVSRWPAGVIPVRVPENAISRAYAKVCEALAWSRLPLEERDFCVEVGCAPGGASQALLDRGMQVMGIDPAEIDPLVADHPDFLHIRKRGLEVRRKEFAGVRWLFGDMNVAPQYTLDTVEDIVTHRAAEIRGLVLTLKLMNWQLAEELPAYVSRVRSWGYRYIRTKQLARGGQEVSLVALRSRHQRRMKR